MQNLTRREKEIFDLLLGGLVPKEIAGKLKISYGSVVSHQKRLYRKLDVHSIKELFEKYKYKKDGEYFVYLKATRWGDPGKPRGENWDSGKSVLLRDFPSDVTRLYNDNDRYAVIVKGTSSTDMEKIKVVFFGLTENDEWALLGGSADRASVSANEPFILNLDLLIDHLTGISSYHNLMDYKEIIIQVANTMWCNYPDNPDWNEDYGKTLEDIPNGHIMAVIRNFNIKLVDKMQIGF